MKPHLLVAVTIASFALIAQALASDEGLTVGFALGGIRGGLDRSPSLYVAGVFETSGKPTCREPENASSCATETKIVEVLASGGKNFRAGDVVLVSGRGKLGERSLAFLVPLEDDPRVFGATFLAVDVHPEDRQTFIEALKQAGL